MLVHVLIPMRVGSERLPKKHLAKLGCIPIYKIIFENARSLFTNVEISFCIPDSVENDVYERMLTSLGANVFRGDEKNVLSRMQDAARKTESTYIARLCGDNVFFVKDLISEMLEVASTHKFKIITNGKDRTFPKGCTFEIIDRITFLSVESEELSLSDREHVFPYFYRNIKADLIKNFYLSKNMNKFDLTVDDPRQMERLNTVWEKLNGRSVIKKSELSKVCSFLKTEEKIQGLSGKTGNFCMLNLGSLMQCNDITLIYNLTKTVRKLGLDAIEFNDDVNFSAEAIHQKLFEIKRIFSEDTKVSFHTKDLDRLKQISSRVNYMSLYSELADSSKLISAISASDSPIFLIVPHTLNLKLDGFMSEIFRLGMQEKLEIIIKSDRLQSADIEANEFGFNVGKNLKTLLVTPSDFLSQSNSSHTKIRLMISNTLNNCENYDIELAITRMKEVLNSNIRSYTETFNQVV